VKVRLDRALADEVFANLLEGTWFQHVQKKISDHCGLLVEIKKISQQAERGNMSTLLSV
jgi:endonuclease/exonuclease/phosphatase family metal-dependent hydrolase